MQSNNPLSHNGQSARKSASIGRLKLLMFANKGLLLLCAVIGLTFASMIGLKQVPYYLTETTLQLQNLSLAGTSSEFSAFDFSVENDMRLRIENAADLIQKETLLNPVVAYLQSHPEAEKILLPDPDNTNFFSVSKLVSAKHLNAAKLRNAVSSMVQAHSDKDKNSIVINVRGRNVFATKIITQAVSEKFLEVTQTKTMERIQKTTKFFQEQLTESRRRLVETEEKLSEYTQRNPYLQNDISRNEYLHMREKHQDLLDDLAAQNKLIDYYREQIRLIKSNVSLPLNAVRTQLQTEIEQLEYDRLKFISEGYSPDHPGIVRIDDKVKRLKGVITSQIERNPAANVAMESDASARIKEMSQKILEIQDQIESRKIALKNLEGRIRELGPTFDVLPEREAIYNRLKRDSDVASQLYLQLSSHVNLMNVRTASENGNWSIISEQADPSGPVGVVPLLNLVIFGIAIGLAIGFSIVLIREVIDPRLVNRDDVEAMGFIYSGKLSENLSEQAEVLATIGQIGTFEGSEEAKAIITCASPDHGMDLTPVQYLTGYLANQGYPTLTIILGSIPVPTEYGQPVSIDFANIYRHPDSKRDLVQVSDRDTFVSLQNLITTSSNRYHAIYLLFKDPLKNASYPLGLKMSNKLLLLGPSHTYTMEAYHELTRGFKFKKSIYFAFSLGAKEQLRQQLKNAADDSYASKVIAGPKKHLTDAEEPNTDKKSA